MKNLFFYFLFIFHFFQINGQSSDQTSQTGVADTDCVEEVFITETVLSGQTDNQSAGNVIYASNIINTGAIVNYDAEVVYLKTGFHAKSNSNFRGFIEGCTTSLSISENGVINSIKVYPNPTKDFLKIITDNEIIASYSILDQLSKIIIKSQVFVNQEDINLKRLPSGLYFMKLILNNGQIIVKKIIKY